LNVVHDSAVATAVRTVFLDRDGVINVDSSAYIKSRAEFHLIPGSLEAMARLTKAGLALILVTNQSALARGLIDMPELTAIHRRLTDDLARLGGRLDDIFYCPHHPDDGCDCRKPKPGMVQQACRRHGIDPASACMVGDSAKDLICARAAGCRYAVLVRSANTDAQLEDLARQHLMPDLVADDLAAAADWILAAPAAPGT